jgi:hypothetical protein
MFVCLVTMRTMKPGHPYLTEELDNLRSAQRKLLAGIPDRWLTAAFPVFQGATTPQALPTDLDRHRLESDFRALLQDRYADIIGWLNQRKPPFRHNDVQSFLDSRAGHFSGVAEQLYNEAMEQRQSQPECPTEFQKPINHVIQLLIWADELADDGYYDPRIPKIGNRPFDPTVKSGH